MATYDRCSFAPPQVKLISGWIWMAESDRLKLSDLSRFNCNRSCPWLCADQAATSAESAPQPVEFRQLPRVDKARSTLLFNEHCCTISPARPSNKIVAAAEEAAFLVVLPFCFLHPSSSFVVVPACPQVLLLVLVYSGWLQL